MLTLLVAGIFVCLVVILAMLSRIADLLILIHRESLKDLLSLMKRDRVSAFQTRKDVVGQRPRLVDYRPWWSNVVESVPEGAPSWDELNESAKEKREAA